MPPNFLPGHQKIKKEILYETRNPKSFNVITLKMSYKTKIALQPMLRKQLK